MGLDLKVNIGRCCWAVGTGCQCCISILKSRQRIRRLRVANAPWETPYCTLPGESSGLWMLMSQTSAWDAPWRERRSAMWTQWKSRRSDKPWDSSAVGGVEVDWRPRELVVGR